jgi:hypothetical protein
VNDELTVPNVDRGSFLAIAVVWLFAAFWNGVIFTILLAIGKDKGATPPSLVAVLSPFILAGLFLIWLALSSTLRTIHYRSLVLRLDAPGVVGGRMAGTIHGAAGVLNDGMSVRLSCWRRSRLSDSTDDMLWEDVEDVPRGSVMQSPVGATVPFRFEIPYECEPAGADDGHIYWHIDLRTRSTAAATFRVPVHRNERSSPEVTEKTLRPRTVAQPPYSRLGFARAADGGVEVRFPRPGWIWKWWLFTFVTAAAATALVRQNVDDPDERLVAFGLIAAGALFLVALIQMGLLFTPRLLRAGRDELRMRFLSPFRGAKVMHPAEIADFITKYDNGTRKYDVAVQRADGGTDPWLMISAVDKREAEWLAQELRAAIGR